MVGALVHGGGARFARGTTDYGLRDNGTMWGSASRAEDGRWEGGGAAEDGCAAEPREIGVRSWEMGKESEVRVQEAEDGGQMTEDGRRPKSGFPLRRDFASLSRKEPRCP